MAAGDMEHQSPLLVPCSLLNMCAQDLYQQTQAGASVEAL